jgi:hypothetical protein
MAIKQLKVISEFDIYAMSNLSDRSTGLPNGIWIWVQDNGYGTSPHALRIKVSNLRGKGLRADSPGFSVSVEEDPPKVVAGVPENFSSKELNAIFSWVKTNRKLLVDLASNVIDPIEFGHKMKKA